MVSQVIFVELEFTGQNLVIVRNHRHEEINEISLKKIQVTLTLLLWTL